MNINYPYKTQQVRDLAWACFSPPLMHIERVAGAASGIHSCVPILDARRRLWLKQLDSEPGALLEHLAQRPTNRLGVYFERLWHFFLQQDSETDLIAHNLSVHHAGQTLGEFDCIYYCHRRALYIHLELAVKYFLGVPRANAVSNIGDTRQWVGPDNRDRLDLKLGQLLRRQILLGDNPGAKNTLDTLGIRELTKEVVLKGGLFQPRTAPIALPLGYNRIGMRGYWIINEEIAAHCATLRAQAYLILPKMRWLSGAHCHDSEEALSLEQLQVKVKQHFASDTYPLLIAAMQTTTVEASRFFVTLPGWPDNLGQA